MLARQYLYKIASEQVNIPEPGTRAISIRRVAKDLFTRICAACLSKLRYGVISTAKTLGKKLNIGIRTAHSPVALMKGARTLQGARTDT